MKKLYTLFTKGKWIWMTLIFFAVIMICMLAISLSQMSGINGAISGLSSWVKTHKYAFLLWHGLIIAAIYYFWGKKVDKEAKLHDLTEDQIKKTKRFRYYMIAFVIVVDLLVHWY